MAAVSATVRQRATFACREKRLCGCSGYGRAENHSEGPGRLGTERGGGRAGGRAGEREFALYELRARLTSNIAGGVVRICGHRIALCCGCARARARVSSRRGSLHCRCCCRQLEQALPSPVLNERGRSAWRTLVHATPAVLGSSAPGARFQAATLGLARRRCCVCCGAGGCRVESGHREDDRSAPHRRAICSLCKLIGTCSTCCCRVH